MVCQHLHRGLSVLHSKAIVMSFLDSFVSIQEAPYSLLNARSPDYRLKLTYAINLFFLNS